MAGNCSLRCITRKEMDGFLLQRELLQKSFELLRAPLRVVNSCNPDTQKSWKEKPHRNKTESHLIVLVIHLEV